MKGMLEIDMRYFLLIICFTALSLLTPWELAQAAWPCHSQSQGVPKTFAQRLETRIEEYNTAGRPMVAVVFDIAYRYETPVALEYVDSLSTTRPLNLQFHDESVRNILRALVDQFPNYEIGFSGDIVDIYSPTARSNSSNLLNRVISEFNVTNMDTSRADMELVCALNRESGSNGVCGGSIATGQWGTDKITLRMRNVKVYEILNAIVSQNGKVVWTVIVPAEKVSRFQTGGLWHIYPLAPPFKGALLRKLNDLSMQASKDSPPAL